MSGADVDAVCAQLAEALPEQVDPGVDRRPVAGDPDRTAAWGDPPVTLECGVRPSERFEPPTAVNGVRFTTRDIGPGTRWTVEGRTVLVAVTVPDAYPNGVEILFPLADAIEAAVPVDPNAPPVDVEP